MRRVECGHADADGGPHRQAPPFEAQLRNAGTDALGRVDRAERIGMRQEDDELFAAEAAEQIWLAT